MTRHFGWRPLYVRTAVRFSQDCPLFIFFQFSLLFSIKIRYFFWICVSCHLLNDKSKNCNFYRVPLRCFFWIIAGAGAGAENIIFFGSGSSKKLRLRLRNTGFLNLFRCMFWPLINDFSPSFSLFFPRLHSSIFFPAAIFPHLYMGSSGRGVPAPQGQKNVDFWTSLRCIFRPLSEDFSSFFSLFFHTYSVSFLIQQPFPPTPL